MLIRRLVALLASSGATALAAAEPPLQLADATPMITVSATRTATLASDVPATVNVITDTDIENLLIEDVKDLVRFEPGIEVRSQPLRPSAAFAATGRDGNSGFTVRGLSGNRVLIQQDLIRLPDAFAFGAQANGRGDFADLEMLKSVEILRGPASPLYGSDGLAGAISFTTRDPEDLIDGGHDIGARARIGYADADQSWTKSAMLAGRTGALSALIAYTRRDSGPARNFGTIDTPDSRRTLPNPMAADSDALLGKLVFDAGSGHTLRLTGELVRRRLTSDVLTGRTPQGPGLPPLTPTSVLRLDLADDTARDRVSLDWRYKGNGLLDDAALVVFHQDSRTRQFSFEDRNTAADRTRDNRFDNRVTGINGQFALAFASGDIRHRVLIGGDFTRTLQTGVRDGTVPPFGETFPTKAFPDTDYDQGGVFVQDSIDIGDGRLLIYPALRFDHYRLSPRPDPLFPGQTVGQSGQRVSPKLGIVGWLTDSFGAFGSYTEGFRSPTPSQVNNGFVNPASGYIALPNPDLRPETSRAFEGGLRLRNAKFGGVTINGQLNGFVARYRDFIDQVQVGGSFLPSNPAVFQFVNFGSVSIEGIEAKLDADFGGGFTGNLALAWAQGTASGARPGQIAVETPLSPMSPFNIVAGLGWRGVDDRLFLQTIVTHSAAKAQADIAESCSPNCFASPAFTVVDATMAFAITPQLHARAGVFNLFNRKYWWWNDVRGLAATSPIADAFTMSGRNISLSLIARY